MLVNKIFISISFEYLLCASAKDPVGALFSFPFPNLIPHNSDVMSICC